MSVLSRIMKVKRFRPGDRVVYRGENGVVKTINNNGNVVVSFRLKPVQWGGIPPSELEHFVPKPAHRFVNPISHF